MSDPNAEQNNTNDGNNIQNIVSPPVNITLASATNNDTKCRNDDSDRSSESCNDTSAAVCSGSRCTRRTSGREDMVSGREEEDLQSACQHCIHLKRRQDRREHLNNALNELRCSLNLAISTPLLPEHFLSVGNESFRRLADVAVPVDLINRVDDEDRKANPLKEANRVELVNRASTIIRDISRDNMRLRQEIGEMIAGRQTSLSWEQQSERDSASY